MPNAPVTAAATGLPKSAARPDELAAVLALFQGADGSSKEAALTFLREAAARRRALANS